MIKKLLPHILFTIRIYLISIAFFTLFRIILFFNQWERLDDTVSIGDIFIAFVIGLRFDVVICSYILMLPFILFSAMYLLNREYCVLKKIVFFFVFVVFSLSFLVCAADIPYFNQFFARANVGLFLWMDSPMFVFKMITQEVRYWIVAIPFILSIVGYYILLKKIFRQSVIAKCKRPIIGGLLISLFGIGLIFLGIRGRIEEKSPIRVGTAYFCNNSFLNQLGLNPNFTLLRSYLDSREQRNKPITLMDDKVALNLVQQYLKITYPNSKFPLLRKVDVALPAAQKTNVVLIIMESMSAAKMKRHGNTENLTPFLDSLSYEGLYFENAYTTGIHTYNGVFSTLFSFPALFRQHPMKESALLKYHGIATTLKEHGYSTLYFTTHDGQFDNIEGFLRENDFEKIISKKDYPAKKIKTTLGVPDDAMFEHSISILNQLNEQNKPFLSVFLTASDHGPYYVPDYFKSEFTDKKKQATAFADYSLQQFIQLASQQNWFDSTIFVFIADHGAPIKAAYSISLDYYHSPLLFFAPKLIREKKIIANIASQMDVFPTIMGILKLPFTNNTMGINLLETERPYVIINADDKYGVLSNQLFLIVNDKQPEELYFYKNFDKKNLAAEMPDSVSKMKQYAEAHLQVFQYIILNNKQ